MLRIECPQKNKETFFEILILDQIISRTKFLLGHILVTSQKFSHFCLTLFYPIRYVIDSAFHPSQVDKMSIGTKKSWLAKSNLTYL